MNPKKMTVEDLFYPITQAYLRNDQLDEEDINECSRNETELIRRLDETEAQRKRAEFAEMTAIQYAQKLDVLRDENEELRKDQRRIGWLIYNRTISGRASVDADIENAARLAKESEAKK